MQKPKRMQNPTRFRIVLLIILAVSIAALFSSLSLFNYLIEDCGSYKALDEDGRIFEVGYGNFPPAWRVYLELTPEEVRQMLAEIEEMRRNSPYDLSTYQDKYLGEVVDVSQGNYGIDIVVTYNSDSSSSIYIDGKLCTTIDERIIGIPRG